MKIIKNCKFKKKCPICNTKETGDAILIGIKGTEEGNICKAELIHLKCINLVLFKEEKIIACRY